MKVNFKLSNKPGTIGKIESCSYCKLYLNDIWNRCSGIKYHAYDKATCRNREIDYQVLSDKLTGTPIEYVLCKIIEDSLVGEMK